MLEISSPGPTRTSTAAPAAVPRESRAHSPTASAPYLARFRRDTAPPTAAQGAKRHSGTSRPRSARISGRGGSLGSLASLASLGSLAGSQTPSLGSLAGSRLADRRFFWFIPLTKRRSARFSTTFGGLEKLSEDA
eukprot:scaffold48_cov311-Pinguiococcus_pyrenoidosus.AAC.37